MKPVTSISPRPASRVPGFTLTELLVVIVIVAVLAVVSFTAARRAIMAANRAGGLVVMRQVGIGTAGFIADHNGLLPGPITANGQSPNYRNPKDATIFSQLIPYLGLEEKNAFTGLPDSLVCPAFRKRYPGWNSDGSGNRAGSTGRIYRLNQDQRINGKRIWGPQSSQDQETGSMSYSIAILGTGRTSGSKIFMLADGSADEMTDPVHGNTRNFLFLDFHAESLPLDFSVNPTP